METELTIRSFGIMSFPHAMSQKILPTLILFLKIETELLIRLLV